MKTLEQITESIFTESEVPRLVPRQRDGALGPYEHMTQEQTIQHVKFGSKPAALLTNYEEKVSELIRMAKGYDLPYFVETNKVKPTSSMLTFYIAKDREILDKLIKVHNTRSPNGLVADPEAEGRLLGYTEKDIQAFRDNQKQLAVEEQKRQAAQYKKFKKENRPKRVFPSWRNVVDRLSGNTKLDSPPAL